jgi:hypothetical protein
VGICGASRGGTLNDAKMVKQSRSMKSAYVGGGMGRGEVVEKSLVKCESFQSERVMFEADVAANFIVPWVVVEQGLERMVERMVSIALAQMYVPP